MCKRKCLPVCTIDERISAVVVSDGSRTILPRRADDETLQRAAPALPAAGLIVGRNACLSDVFDDLDGMW